METKKRVAVLGGGTVGGELVRLLAGDHPGRFEVTGVLVRNVRRPRDFPEWRQLVTDDPTFVEDAEIVIEAMGGTSRAFELSIAALERGQVLVSANKAALAERWDDYLPHLQAGRLFFEAAVMAGTPVIGPLTGALRGSRPNSLHAVLNGTCNVILAEMETGVTYEAALEGAQRAGFAEADPTLDVMGVDAAHKLNILGRLAFDPNMSWGAVRPHVQGITELTAEALSRAREEGKRVRLIASIVPSTSGWNAQVRPVALPAAHPLITAGPENAVLYTGDPGGRVLLRGPGAGGGPTASGVLGDLLAAARGERGPAPLEAPAPLPNAAGDDLTELMPAAAGESGSRELT